jgi:hypothetical protein
MNNFQTRKLLVISSALIIGGLSTWTYYCYKKFKNEKLIKKIIFNYKLSSDYVFVPNSKIIEYMINTNYITDLKRLYEYDLQEYPSIKEVIDKILEKYTKTNVIKEQRVIINIKGKLAIDIYITTNPNAQILVFEL